MKVKEQFLNLKVYKNKKTGQLTVILPKKKIKKEITKIKVKW